MTLLKVTYTIKVDGKNLTDKIADESIESIKEILDRNESLLRSRLSGLQKQHGMLFDLDVDL